MKRLADWRIRFAQYQVDCAAKPFSRGEHDCALYIARGAEAITGQDFVSRFIGQYSDLRSAVKTLRRLGSGNLEQTIAAYATRFEVYNKPRVGDVAIVPRPGGNITGFFVEQGISLVGPKGLVYVAQDQASAGYRVG